MRPDKCGEAEPIRIVRLIRPTSAGKFGGWRNHKAISITGRDAQLT